VTSDAASARATLAQLERGFLDASIAVWTEIDKHTHEGIYAAGVPAQLARDGELRRAERLAWEAYRDALRRWEDG
jgi:hypothetical protein